MDRKAAKELLHIHGWLQRVDEIIQRGKDAYLADDLLQEAGDSLANRNLIIHQYDEINRELTWLTLSHDLPAWRSSLEPLFTGAAATIETELG